LRANRKKLDDEKGRHKKNNLLVPALSVWGQIAPRSLRDDAFLQFFISAPFFLAGFSIIMSNLNTIRKSCGIRNPGLTRRSSRLRKLRTAPYGMGIAVPTSFAKRRFGI
jgi:hypothetical protein